MCRMLGPQPRRPSSDETEATATFSHFCGRREADGLFSEAFVNAWVRNPFFENCTPPPKLNDDFSMFMMGGELW